MPNNKAFLNPFALFSATDMMFTQTSDPVAIKHLDNAGIQLKWTGTAEGVITVEVSNTYDPTPTVPVEGDWDPLTFNPALTQPAGSAGGYAVNLNQLPFAWVRMNWEPDTVAVQSTLVVQDLTYTAVAYGAVGDDITITYVDPSANSQPLDVEVTGTDIVVSLATNGSGTITTTATQLLAAIVASEEASALVTAVISGTGSDVQTAASETPLAGGAGEVGAISAVITAKSI